LLSHLIPFLALAATFVLVPALAGFTSLPARSELALSALVVAAVIFVAVREIVLAGVSLTGPLADLYALLFALARTASLFGLALQSCARRAEPIRDGLWTVLSPLALRPTSGALARAASLAALAAVAYVVSTEVAIFDWNYL